VLTPVSRMIRSFAPSSDADVSQSRQYDFEDGALRVTVTRTTLTGTMHSADSVVITSPGGTVHLGGGDFAGGDVDRDDSAAKSPADGIHAEGLPLFERALAAGAHRWVLLGWSSFGEGMQSEHAWLVEDGAGGPRVVDSLVWRSDRMHGGVALDLRTSVRVGVPIPDATEHVHNADMWQLRHDGRVFTLAETQAMPRTITPVTGLHEYYDPPDGGAPSSRHWAGRFVWFAPNANGFVASRP
jgi:hypothetical protein